MTSIKYEKHIKIIKKLYATKPNNYAEKADLLDQIYFLEKDIKINEDTKLEFITELAKSKIKIKCLKVHIKLCNDNNQAMNDRIKNFKIELDELMGQDEKQDKTHT